MAELENRMLEKYHMSPLVWFRFLDDIFFIWLHDKESLLEFFSLTIIMKLLNIHRNIRKRVPYLDVQVDLESGKLQTDVYSKLTDTNQYLDCNSSCLCEKKTGLRICIPC